MLDALRRGAQGWLAKLLFAVLIVSFGIIWNVSDAFRGYGQGAVAEVGGEDISARDFQRAFQDNLRSLKEEAGGRITAEQALLFGLDRQALEQLIAQAAVKAHSKELGLGLSDMELARGLQADPNFQGPDGKFSRVGFNNLLQQINLSEQAFFALRREDELRRQITDALRGAIVAPVPLVEGLNSWREEQRTLEHVQIDAAKVSVPDPDEAKLRETYEANKQRFMTPEYRKVGLMLLTVDGLKKEVTLTDDELKAYYTENKAAYDQPERRRVQQIAFKDRAAAEAARKAILDGTRNFMDAAKDAGANESDVNLGLVEKSKLIDPKIADAIFSLERDKLSDVVEGRFATVLVRSVEIEPGKESTFDEVKDKVRDKLSGQRAANLLQDRIDLVEEGRNAGKTLSQIAAELKLSFIEADQVSSENKTPEGKTAIDNPNAEAILKDVFRATAGVTNDMIEVTSDSYAWFDVVSVTEPKQKPFDEVKDEVKAYYTDTERSRLIGELASKLVDRLKAGEEFAKVAVDAGGAVETTDSIKRQMSPPGLTTDGVKLAFTLPKGGAASAETSDRATRVVFQVKEIEPPATPSKEQADKIAIEIRTSLESDMLLGYIAGLKTDLGVTVNQTELKRATGVAPSQ